MYASSGSHSSLVFRMRLQHEQDGTQHVHLFQLFAQAENPLGGALHLLASGLGRAR
jgi:hypothetical protein